MGPLGACRGYDGLQTDDAVEILEALDDDAKLPDPERRCRQRSAPHRAGTDLPGGERRPPNAARLVAVPPHWLVGETIDFLRARDDLPDDFNDLSSSTPRTAGRRVAFTGAIRNKRAVRLTDIMET